MGERESGSQLLSDIRTFFILSTITTFRLVRIARMGRPGCFTKDVMHFQIDDTDEILMMMMTITIMMMLIMIMM